MTSSVFLKLKLFFLLSGFPLQFEAPDSPLTPSSTTTNISNIDFSFPNFDFNSFIHRLVRFRFQFVLTITTNFILCLLQHHQKITINSLTPKKQDFGFTSPEISSNKWGQNQG